MFLLTLIAIVFASLIFVILLTLYTLADQRAMLRARSCLRLGKEGSPSRFPRWKERFAAALQAVQPPPFFNRLMDEGTVTQAGIPFDGRGYRALWWLLVLSGTFLAAVLMVTGSLSLFRVILGLGVILLPAAGPYLFLHGRIRERERAVARGLPDFLDILTFTVEAGLGFMPALRRVSEGSTGILGEELKRVLVRVDLGFTRREALGELVERLPSSDVEHFVEAINLSEHLGTSLARTLRVQAYLLRTRRRQRAEVKAQTEPIRIIPALVFSSCPVCC